MRQHGPNETVWTSTAGEQSVKKEIMKKKKKRDKFGTIVDVIETFASQMTYQLGNYRTMMVAEK